MKREFDIGSADARLLVHRRVGPTLVWSEVIPADRIAAELSDTERTRAASYESERARDQFVTGAWLIRRTLMSLGHVDTDGRATVERRCRQCGSQTHGRPMLRNSALNLTVSHSGSLVVVAVAPLMVGVDVEQRSRLSQLLARRHQLFSPAERQAIASDAAQSGDLAVDLWAAKEAVTKARGTGLVVRPSSLDLLEAVRGETAVHAPSSKPLWLHRIQGVPRKFSAWLAYGRPLPEAVAQPVPSVQRQTTSLDHPSP